MGDRNLQEWISDQLYTLLGKHARSKRVKLVYTSALVDLPQSLVEHMLAAFLSGE